MSLDEEKEAILKTVTALRARFGMPVDAARRGPVQLARFLDECNLLHVTLPRLTRAEIAKYLRAEGIEPDLDEKDGKETEWLAGLLMTTGPDGFVFVSEMEPKPRKEEEEQQFGITPLGRRRFTAAHELGHFVLHRDRMGRWLADTKETVIEANDQEDTREMERQANCFAAVLLMPGEVCLRRAEDFFKVYKTCPRTPFAYFLAAELLVSPEAMRNRLKELKVGDE
jgi:hypothetical protein